MLELFVSRNLTMEAMFSHMTLSGEKKLLLVPELFSHEYERALLQRFGNGVSREIEVLSFERLCHRVFEEIGGLADSYVEEGAKYILMHRAISRYSGGMYGNLKAAPKLLETIDRLKCGKIMPETILEMAGEAQGALAEKLRELGYLYTAYSGLFGQLSDPRELLDKADFLKSRFFDGLTVYIDGFFGFTPQEYRLLGQIFQKSKAVFAFIQGSFSDGQEAFDESRRTVLKLEAIAQRLGQKPIKTQIDEVHPSALLEQLRTQLFAFLPMEAQGKSEALSVYSLADSYQECEFVLSEIRRLVFEKGYEFKDFAICARNFDAYSKIFSLMAQRYEVPLYFSEKTPLLDQPVLAMFLQAADCVLNGFRLESVLAYGKTGFSGLGRDEIYRLENYARSWRISGNRWTKPFSENPAGYEKTTQRDEKELERLEDLRQRLITPLEEFTKRSKGRQKGRDFAGHIYTLACDTGMRDKLAQVAKQQEAAGHLQSAKEYLALWEVLMSALDQFGHIETDEMDFGEFCELFRLVLSSYDIATIPVSLDRVEAGPIDRITGKNRKILFLMGANEGVLPPPITGEGIFTLEDVEQLTAMGLETFETDLNLREQFYIYKAISVAKERLLISFSRELSPSFVAQTAGLLVGGIETPRGEALQLWAETPCLQLALTAKTNPTPYSIYAYAIMEKQAEEILKREAKSEDTHNIRRLYGAVPQLTASRLDKLGACPFAYFMQYGLKAKPRRVYDLDAMKMGSFLHYILEHVVEKEAKIGFRQGETLESFINTLTEAFVLEQIGDLSEKTARFRYLFEKLAASALDIATTVLQELRSSKFTPLDFELDFGHEGSLPSIPITGEEGLLAEISGKVDRVDGYIENGRLYIRVMDYKSGKKSFDLSDVWHGLNLQLLIYLFSVEKEGLDRYRGRITQDLNQIQPAGVLYVQASKPVISGEKNLAESAIEELRLKQLRRSGLVCDNVDILRAMEDSDKPHFLPIAFNKTGELSARSSVASLAQLGQLSRFIDDKLRQLSQLLKEGKTGEAPYKKTPEDTACTYCDYKGPCRFEGDRDSYRQLSKLEKDEFWIGVEHGNQMDS